MPLVLDPDRLPSKVLEELHANLRTDLSETLEMVERPRGKVLDPASLATAGDLVRASMAILEAPAPRGARELAAEANLAYATMLAAIDLVKSHTDLPKVPPARPVRHDGAV